MQINKELLERALVEGVEVEDNPDYSIVSLATKENGRWTGFHTTSEWINTSRWEYVCTLTEYLKAKAEKEKMQEFKVGDRVDVEHSNDSYSERLIGCEIIFCGKEYLIVIGDDGREVPIYISAYTLKPHRKTQDWFGVEIDEFMAEKPKQGDYLYFFDIPDDKLYSSYTWDGDKHDEDIFNAGIWDSEEKAKRSAPLMYKRLVEMAGVK